jgi:hypothetical protein
LFFSNTRAPTPPAVTVQWSTASELNTAGFNVLRGDNPNGPFTRVNPEVIPASPDSLVGGSYVFTDTHVTAGQTYYYQLDEVEVGGSISSQGTVVVTAPYSVEPVVVAAGVGLSIILIAALLWIERPRHPSTPA